MSIQVLEGGLATPPVYDVPQYPHHAFDCETIGQLIDIVVATGMVPVAEARELWVTGNTWDTREKKTLFSTALFNEHGEEIASMTYDMRRGQFHAKPNGRGRIWGRHLDKTTQTRDIGYLVELALGK